MSRPFYQNGFILFLEPASNWTQHTHAPRRKTRQSQYVVLGGYVGFPPWLVSFSCAGAGAADRRFNCSSMEVSCKTECRGVKIGSGSKRNSSKTLCQAQDEQNGASKSKHTPLFKAPAFNSTQFESWKSIHTYFATAADASIRHS